MKFKHLIYIGGISAILSFLYEKEKQFYRDISYMSVSLYVLCSLNKYNQYNEKIF
jgi:hypothetical protein